MGCEKPRVVGMVSIMIGSTTTRCWWSCLHAVFAAMLMQACCLTQFQQLCTAFFVHKQLLLFAKFSVYTSLLLVRLCCLMKSGTVAVMQLTAVTSPLLR